ncbi:MAG: polysaccharide pyruvyl transferase family protein [Lachnospiraceae bacterium]|nr:polysaccharide pyruvyl transferase family protein [Lachnospiraceae bacterium]
MKKIAIVSCYFQHNYGSMLQAYATQMVLDKLGYDNETIDISGFNQEIKKAKIKYFIKASLTSSILASKMGMVKNILLKRVLKNEYSSLSDVRSRKFETFKNKYFRLSKKYHSKNQLSKECELRYSAVVVGSDQLWLPGNIAADYYTLNFVPKSVNTVAYATSFGQSSLPRDSAKKAATFLRRIRHIGIREESGQKLIKQLTNRNVPVVCDPTMLFTGEDWMSIQQETPIIEEPYIFCYFLGNNPPHREFAKRLKKETGYKIVALTHLDEYVKCDEDYADEKPYNVDPADFLNLIHNASYICTDSFHCTVFSILYRRDFFTFHRYAGNTKQSTNSRIDSLFHMLEIGERIMQGEEDVRDSLKTHLDFDCILNKLAHVREESYRYLVMALNDDEGTDLS